MRAPRTASLVAAALGVLLATGVAAAQLKLGGMNVEGEVEAGFQGLVDKPSKNERAKFEEYRDIPEGLFLERLKLRFFRPDESYSAELQGSKWGYDDQEFSIRAGRLGLWEFLFEWDQTPHIFSTNARTHYDQVARDRFALPATRPGLATWNSAPEPDEIGVRWDTSRIGFRLTPTPELDLKLEYTRIKKDGERPLGMAFGSPGGDHAEILEPIEQTIHDFRLRGTIAREQWQAQFGYAFSLFHNSLERVFADNPRFGVAGQQQSGQSALPPDNMAHTFSLAGGANLPWWRTRVTSNLSYSLRLQNENFLPHTIIQAVANDPDLVLPQGSLNGNVQIFLGNLNVVTRPLRPLTVTARYRIFDFNDLSDQPIFPGHVVNDQATVTREARRAHRQPYTKQNAELDGRWRFGWPVALTLGSGWEYWNRNDEHREVPESDEVFIKAALDLTPYEWLLARLTYMPSRRWSTNYNTRAHASHVVEIDGVSAAQGQSLLLRKFDQGDRERQRVDLLVQLTPTDRLTVTGTAGYRYDDYVGATLGLQEETAWSAGSDVTWMPVERVSLSGGYVHESFDRQQRSRNRPVTGTTTFDFADYDWVSENTDTVDTFHGGVKAVLIPKVLDFNLGANYSYALGRIKTNNPVAPTSGTAAQRATATAKPMPAFEDALLRLEASLKYYFLKNWTATLGYIFEAFDKHDWRTDELNPFIPGVNSIWLGNDQKDYTAHIIAFTIGYRFK